jgi:LacI family transcriptional regulator
MRDVARAAGVSVATISRVVNRSGEVAAPTREHVLEVVRELGYATNRSASALSGGRTGLVGVVLPRMRAPYFDVLVDAIVHALIEHDLRAVICPSLREHGESGLLDTLVPGVTEGAVVVLPSESSAELRAVHERGYPLVVLDPKTPLEPGIPSVSAANTSGAVAAVEHLIELGHRRIGAVTGPPGWCATEERLSGYRAALASVGIVPEPSLIAPADFEVAGGRTAADRLLSLREPPTAVLAFNDNLAVGTCQAARARGLSVPGDLSVVGFDDSAQAALVTPPLTTVRQPLDEMARVAVGLLVRQLAGGSIEPLRIDLATSLVVRGSTAPPTLRGHAVQAA